MLLDGLKLTILKRWLKHKKGYVRAKRAIGPIFSDRLSDDGRIAMAGYSDSGNRYDDLIFSGIDYRD